MTPATRPTPIVSTREGTRRQTEPSPQQQHGCQDHAANNQPDGIGSECGKYCDADRDTQYKARAQTADSTPIAQRRRLAHPGHTNDDLQDHDQRHDLGWRQGHAQQRHGGKTKSEASKTAQHRGNKHAENGDRQGLDHYCHSLDAGEPPVQAPMTRKYGMLAKSTCERRQTDASGCPWDGGHDGIHNRGAGFRPCADRLHRLSRGSTATHGGVVSG